MLRNVAIAWVVGLSVSRGPQPLDVHGSEQEEWFVAANGTVRSMTLDQLDEAFRAGVIDEATSVWTQGMQAWATLGALTHVASGAAPAEAEGVDVEFEDEVPTLRERESRTGVVQRQAANDVSRQTVRDGRSARSGARARPSDVTAGPALRVPDGALCKAPPARRPRRQPQGQAQPQAQPFPSESHSTAPLAMSLTEPVIPFRRDVPRRDLKLWAAAAAAVLGLALYGASVLPLATMPTSASKAPAPSALPGAPTLPASPTPRHGARPVAEPAVSTAVGQPSAGASPVRDVPSARDGSPPAPTLRSKKTASAQPSKSLRRKSASSKRKNVRKTLATSASKKKSAKSKSAPRPSRPRPASSVGKSG